MASKIENSDVEMDITFATPTKTPKRRRKTITSITKSPKPTAGAKYCCVKNCHNHTKMEKPINGKEKAQKFKHMIPELYFYMMHIFLLQNNNKSDTKEEYDGCNQRTDNDKKVDEHISTLPVGL